jgi:hypothetical protein
MLTGARLPLAESRMLNARPRLPMPRQGRVTLGLSDVLRLRAPDGAPQTRPHPGTTDSRAVCNRRPGVLVALLSAFPLPLSAAEKRQEILETNGRARPLDEPCSRSMHVKMHKRKQPVGSVAEMGDR